jgi:hypothetical protein
MKLKLKLVKSYEKPKVGDLVTTRSKSLDIIVSKEDYGYEGISDTAYREDVIKPVLPYGLSDEEIKEGDTFYTGGLIAVCSGVSKGGITLIDYRTTSTLSGKASVQDSLCKKVVAFPNMFDNQQILDLKLKDGDEFEWNKVEPSWTNTMCDETEYPPKYVMKAIPKHDPLAQNITIKQKGYYNRYGIEDQLHASYAKDEEPVIYTEREVMAICWESLNKDFSSQREFEEWFKQFKKKS